MNHILVKSTMFFAQNGVEGTKIGDLTKKIGVSQGAIYVYFKSKEDLYDGVVKYCQSQVATDALLSIAKMEVPAIRKLRYVSDSILKNLSEDKLYSAQMLLALEGCVKGTAPAFAPLYDLMRSIIKEGQKDGAFAKGDAGKTADYFWSVVYIYSVKKCLDPKYNLLSSSELERVVRG